MTKTVKHVEPLLRSLKASIFSIKLGLVKLLTTLQNLLIGFGWVDEDGPFAIADNKLMDGLATMHLPLSGPQPPKEGFQLIVGAVALRPGITLEQARPALAEGAADMCDHTRILRTVLCVLLQLGQKLLDLAFDLTAGRGRLPLDFRWVETTLQFHKEAPLTFELSVVGGKRMTERDHGQQLIQEWVPPFCRLRVSEASNRARSSNTRRPPSAKGGLLPSVRVLRIKSA